MVDIIERKTGSFSALGFSSAEITFNPSAKHEYFFCIADNNLYIKDLITNELVLIEKRTLKAVPGPLDKVMKVYRFAITAGKYANEYVIGEETVDVNSHFKDVDAYMNWIKSL